jgi:tetratricopeptide (TPR) repeat protein
MNPTTSAFAKTTTNPKTIATKKDTIKSQTFFEEVSQANSNTDIQDIIAISGVELESLVKAKLPQKILYSDKPLSAKNAAIRELTPHELGHNLGFLYTESLHATGSMLSEFHKHQLGNPSIRQPVEGAPTTEAILERLCYPLEETFVVCNMGIVGHGLFACKDIPSGTVLFLYAGIIDKGREFEKQNSDDYAMALSNDGSFTISSKKAGNLSRFMQYLPIDLNERKENIIEKVIAQQGRQAELAIKEKPEMMENFFKELFANAWDDFEGIYFQDQNIKKEVAKSNISISNILIGETSVLVCWAPDLIKQNEQIGFSYGNSYWKTSQCNPIFFDKKGEIILPFNYHLSAERSNFSNISSPQLYDNAVMNFKMGNYYQSALELIQAITKFGDENCNSLEVATCYSTLASCFRDLKKSNLALQAIEQAISIYKLHNESSEKIKQKYETCIILHFTNKNKFDLAAIYKYAINLYKANKFLQSSYVLHLLIDKQQYDEQITTKLLSDRATYYSTLASCYRELNQYDLAIVNIKKGLEIIKSLEMPSDPKRVEAYEKKLAGLENS